MVFLVVVLFFSTYGREASLSQAGDVAVCDGLCVLTHVTAVLQVAVDSLCMSAPGTV